MAGLLDLFPGLGGLLGGQMPPQQQPQQYQPQMAPQLPIPTDPDRLGAAFQNFGHGSGWLGAFADAMTGLTTGQRTDPVGLYQQQSNQVYQSLLRAGYPEPQARLAAVDPATLKNITALPELKETGTDPLTGQKSFAEYRPQIGTLTPVGGQGGGTVGPGSGILASGVSQHNPNLVGEDYLNQFSPETKAAVRAYMAGDVMPTGNARAQNISTAAKTIAQKYAQDLGIPDVNDERYNAKRKMITDLASSSPSSMGGILTKGTSAFRHLGELAGNFTNLGNALAGDFPFGGTVADIKNYWKNKVAASGTTREALTSTADNLLKYGQESTSFYSATGGGETERLAALRGVNPQTSTANEQAGFLQTEKNLMLDRLAEKENQIRQTLGEDYLQKHPIRSPAFEAAVKKIDDSIAQLHGIAGTKPPPAPGQPAVAAAAPGTAPIARTPTPEAISALKANPQRANEFDAYYGRGSAMKVLGGA